MAPNFALFLSPEGIALAQRQTGGHWAVLGDTALDVPDLGAALVVLRKLAEARVGKGFDTLVILPDDQVLYTSLTAPGPDDETRLEQIREGLDGLTPYKVDDLAFDWVPLEDGRVKLAVAATETLEEAREFAESNGFHAVGFGARPLDNRYPGMAHFDRSIEWTADIPDIEFGLDTWKPDPAQEAVQDADAPAEEETAEAVHPPTEAPEPGDAAEPEDIPPESTAAPAQDAAPVQDAGPDPVQQAEPESPPQADAAEPVAETPPAEVADSAPEVPAPADPAPADPAPEEDAAPEAEESPPAGPAPEPEPQDTNGPAETGRRRLTLGAAAGPAPEPSDDTATDTTPPPPQEPGATEEPIEIPAGFGAHRRKPDPDKAGTRLGKRKPRFGPASADADPDLPRSRKEPGDAKQDTPVFGRGKGKTGKPPPVISAPDGADTGTPPERPPFAGPEPQLPPLARVKSRIQERQETGPRPVPTGPNPFDGPPPDEDRLSIRDRMAGFGRQLTESTGKARDAASGLSGRLSRSRSGLGERLRGLGRKPPEEEAQAAEPLALSEATVSENPTPESGSEAKAEAPPKPAKRGKGRKKDQAAAAPEQPPSTAPDEAPFPPPPQAGLGARSGGGRWRMGLPRRGAGKAAQASASEAAARIAPPDSKASDADPPRRRFSAAKTRAEPARISDADEPIMGGLLARGDLAARNGPSVRTGLILSLLLLVLLAIVGLWAALYLPETALGRWMGLGTEEDAVIIVETEPEVLTPPAGLASPTAEDGPGVVASLTPGDTPPAPAATAPEAPELLPDIDAEVLDLGPAPVSSPVIDPETVLPSEEENANFHARTGIWQRPPVITLPQPVTRLEEVMFVGLDPVVVSHDAIALPVPAFRPSDDLPMRQRNPIAPDSNFVLDENGLVAPSPDGTLNPDGILVYAGTPAVAPQPRPLDAPEVLAAAETEAAAEEVAAAGPTPGAVETALLQALRPQVRPEDLQEQRERAVLGGITYDELAAIRPAARPASFQEQAAAAAAAAEAADPEAEPGDLTGATELAVAVSFLPAQRPGNIDEMVEQARAAGYTTAEPPAAGGGTDTVEPEIPSSASVARAATEEDGINLRDVNLIGVSGSESDRRALVRLPSGRFLTVEVGDRLDGGQVAAIGESSLQYVKRGRTITLEVPSG